MKNEVKFLDLLNDLCINPDHSVDSFRNELNFICNKCKLKCSGWQAMADNHDYSCSLIDAVYEQLDITSILNNGPVYSIRPDNIKRYKL